MSLSLKSERTKQVEDQHPNGFNLPAGEPAVPQLADGTRKNTHVPSAKGLRIATRCQTVENFIATYHPICEDAAIFLPNTRRAVGAITQFTFALAGGEPVLIGIGAVIEEFTTAENRFGHIGIVVSVQQLARGSTSIFEQLLAARARKAVAVDHTPTPIFARTATGPVTMANAVKAAAPRSEAAKVQIPNPVDRHTRAKTANGIAPISKPPTLAIKVPTIVVPQVKKPEATPNRGFAKRPTRAELTPAAPANVLDASWDAIADECLDAIPATAPDPSDTIRDVMPYALHHTLGKATPASPETATIPEAAAVATPNPPAEAHATPVAASTADGSELATSDESEIVTTVGTADEPRVATDAKTADAFETVTSVGTADEILVFRALSDVAMAAVMPVAPVEPSEITTDEAADESAVAMTAASSDPDDASTTSTAATLDAAEFTIDAEILDERVETSERLNTPAAILAPSPMQTVEDFVVTSSQPSSRAWRWVAAFAALVMLIAASTTRRQGIESAPTRTDSALKSAAASQQDEPDRQADASPPPPVEPLGQHTTTQTTKVKRAPASPARTAKAPARAPVQKVRPQPRPVRRVIARPKCSSLDCL
ncbi:MAG: hypothetical protein H0T65_09230 [Deltaproteobacteria bacterium]|nr:hypothetical protein [Deltaproteobacteria bacterium]